MAGNKSTYLNQMFLDLIFKSVTNAVLASAVGSATTVTVALHTADPGIGGTQSTSETAYTGYARLTKNRSTDWTRTGSSLSPAANLDFGQCTASPGAAITYFSVGDGTNIWYSGPVTANITMAVGVIPRLTTATAVTEA